MSSVSPEIGKSIITDGYVTNYHDVGSGPAMLMLHGSGAGVSGWANWRGIMPQLSEHFRVIVPDMVGFGYTETPDDLEFRIFDTWISQMMSLLDQLGIEKTHLVGNSFGGGLSLHLAIHYPDRFDRIVLMGAGGVPMPLNDNLAELWQYKPSVENMKRVMDIMAYNRDLVTDELAELRYQATIRPGAQEAFERVFPEPLQRHLDAQIVSDEQLASLPNETLIIHGRDDRVVPFANSMHMFNTIPNAQLHAFGKCGHWTQIEHADRFRELVVDFFGETI
ncbi:MAG: alpha/beta hydrolase [Actinobacteria bacterium]|jgi:2-hydroxymuconate-semialdehyde hydrolase|nr:alpha/beta hydrolase [Actinomycetota bacterium]